MPVNLCNFGARARDAVKAFWQNPDPLRGQQGDPEEGAQSGRADVGETDRMGGFADLVKHLVEANGLKDATITLGQPLPVLPELFDPAKKWDMLILHQERLVAAVEFTAHIGSPEIHSNTCFSEALGAANDLWTAYREGKLGEDAPRPFLGQLTLVEDTRHSSGQTSAYATRYDLLCKKLVRENLYTASCLLLSPRTAVKTGKYTELSELTNLETFVTGLASHVAAEAAKTKRTGESQRRRR